MKTLLLAYAIVYALAFVFLYLAETVVIPAPERQPLWETLLDLALITTGFVGMVLYLREADQPRIIWRVVAPVLVVAQAWMFVRYLRERPKLLAEAPEMGEREAAWLELAADILMVPSLMINMAYAYA